MLRSTFNGFLRPLTTIVQVRETGGGNAEWWETIAAFNVKDVAEYYARDCRRSGRQYRIVDINDEKNTVR